MKAVWNRLLDDDNDVRGRCVQALVKWNSRFPASFKSLETRLLRALKSPQFEKLDNMRRPAFDYVYEILWQIVIGEDELSHTEDLDGFDDLGDLGDHPF